MSETCPSTSGTATVLAKYDALTTPLVNGSRIACDATTGTVTVSNYDATVTYTLYKGTVAQSNTFSNAGVFSGLAAGNDYTVVASKSETCPSTSGTATVLAKYNALTTPLVNGSRIACDATTGTVTVSNYDATVTYTLYKGTVAQSNTISNAGVFSGLAAGNDYTVVASKSQTCPSTSGTATV